MGGWTMIGQGRDTSSSFLSYFWLCWSVSVLIQYYTYYTLQSLAASFEPPSRWFGFASNMNGGLPRLFLVSFPSHPPRLHVSSCPSFLFLVQHLSTLSSVHWNLKKSQRPSTVHTICASSLLFSLSFISFSALAQSLHRGENVSLFGGYRIERLWISNVMSVFDIWWITFFPYKLNSWHIYLSRALSVLNTTWDRAGLFPTQQPRPMWHVRMCTMVYTPTSSILESVQRLPSQGIGILWLPEFWIRVIFKE